MDANHPYFSNQQKKMRTFIIFEHIYSTIMTYLSLILFAFCAIAPQFSILYQQDTKADILTTSAPFIILIMNIFGSVFGTLIFSHFEFKQKINLSLNHNRRLEISIFNQYCPGSIDVLILCKLIICFSSGISCSYITSNEIELHNREWYHFIGTYVFFVCVISLLLLFLQISDINIKYHLYAFAFYYNVVLLYTLVTMFAETKIATMNTRIYERKSFVATDLDQSFISIMIIIHFIHSISTLSVFFVSLKALLMRKLLNKQYRGFMLLSHLIGLYLSILSIEYYDNMIILAFTVAAMIISFATMFQYDFYEWNIYLYPLLFEFSIGHITWFMIGSRVPKEFQNMVDKTASIMNLLLNFLAIFVRYVVSRN